MSQQDLFTHNQQQYAHEQGVLARSVAVIDRRDLVWIAGVDEAGRGPLIGSVVAAAVVLNPHDPIDGLNDSKKLSAKQREFLFAQIQSRALAWAIAEATHDEIDQLNILQATLLAMRRAVMALPLPSDQALHEVLIDGNRCPVLPVPCRAIVGGDRLEACISAASILAKVSRDWQLEQLHQQYPQYGFAQHKGYPTAQHVQALQQYGVLAQHRRSYAPVKAAVLLCADQH